MMKKEIVALYVRVSTQEQAREGYSIEEQKGIQIALTIIAPFWYT